DGIRDKLVTGVQTCALPIFATWTTACRRSFGVHWATWSQSGGARKRSSGSWYVAATRQVIVCGVIPVICRCASSYERPWLTRARSEERRVGKSVDRGGRRCT